MQRIKYIVMIKVTGIQNAKYVNIEDFKKNTHNRALLSLSIEQNIS